MGRRWGQGLLRPIAQKPSQKARRIAVEDHRVAFQRAPIRQDNPGHAARLPINPAHRAAIFQRDTLPLGQRCQSGGQPVHAAFNRPNAPRFGLPDQRQHRRRQMRRAADLGGIAPKQLLQARIIKAARQMLSKS